jgi:NAD(P)-dependent dehydrogenase (short-subunit alcohol dehydrogenase family)
MNYRAAVVTGAASGMGRELALQLARSGTAVAALDVDRAGLARLEAELADMPSLCRVADVRDRASMNAAIDQAERMLGPIDLVIACAGINTLQSMRNLRVDHLERILGVNVIGVVNTFAPALERMLLRRRGHLTAISSVASLHGLPYMLSYCASKAGLNAWMEGLRVELVGTGIHSTTICPAWIDTEMNADATHSMPGLISASDAAGRILRAVRRKRRFYAFPRTLVWKLRLLRLLPAALQDRLLAHSLTKTPPPLTATEPALFASDLIDAALTRGTSPSNDAPLIAPIAEVLT